MKPYALVLVGPPGLGKAAWATSFGDPDYMRSAMHVDGFHLSSTHLVVDDVSLDHFPPWKSVLECRDVFHVADGPNPVQEIPFSKPTVWICNKDKDPRSNVLFTNYKCSDLGRMPIVFVDVKESLCLQQ